MNPGGMYPAQAAQQRRDSQRAVDEFGCYHVRERDTLQGVNLESLF